MIIGATPETDYQILNVTEALYQKFGLKRVFYSAFIHVNEDKNLPARTEEGPPLLREHRLYQADWLLRFYGFNADEITGENGFLSTEYDPKCAWALKNLGLFPIEVNTASFELLVRVPGIGLKSALRIIQARRQTNLNYEDLKRLRVVLKRAMHFVTCCGKFYGAKNEYSIKNYLIGAEISENAEQLCMFNSAEISALTGEL
jgi:predicted DNA-binding helix-hairpin-helix protein